MSQARTPSESTPTVTIQARHLVPGDWVNLVFFFLQVKSLTVGRKYVMVWFVNDSASPRHWPVAFSIHVAHPRPLNSAGPRDQPLDPTS